MRPVVCALLLLVTVRTAHAFPELAARTETATCGSCHISPGGGGLINEYGRMEAGDSLSRGGDGRVFHGAVVPPSWLLVGGDLRAAALAYDDTDATEGTQLAAFPMQADLHLGVQRGAFTVVATGGVRGSTRRYDRSDSSYVISAEHYVMFTHGDLAIRAGRLFPVQGLRLPDHTLYVRRYTGTNLYEQPYALAVSYTTSNVQLHAAGFVHDPVLDVGRREAGAVVHAEIDRSTWSAATSLRFGHGDDGTRTIAGLSGHVNAGSRSVVLVEADLIHDQVAGATTVNQLAALVGVDHRLAQGVQLFGWYEHYEEVLGLRTATHHGVGAALKVYPHAHWELILQALAQRISGANLGLGMLQVHYYL